MLLTEPTVQPTFKAPPEKRMREKKLMIDENEERRRAEQRDRVLHHQSMVSCTYALYLCG